MPNRYIIDTSVLIQFPHILSRAGNRKIVIPSAVMEEISMRSHGGRTKGVSDLIASSLGSGVKIVKSLEFLENDLIESDKNAQRLSSVDFEIARIAIAYAKQKGPDSPCVVTEDLALRNFLSTRGIQSISGKQFIGESANEPINLEIKESADQVVSSQKRYIFSSFILGVVTSLLGSLVYSYINLLISTITIWGTMIALPLMGIALFWYRENYRLSYGVFEFCVGVIMAYYVFFPSFNYSNLGVTQGIQVLGGLYVMVRGLDNIGKGVEGTRVHSLWKKIF